MKSNKEKKTKHIKGAYKSVNVDLNDIELFKLCFNVDDDGFRQFTGEKGEIVILERYVSDKDDHREFNPAIIEEIDEYGLVKFWDLVREQWMYIDWTAQNIPIILHINDQRALKNTKTRRRQNTECIQESSEVESNYSQEVE